MKLLSLHKNMKRQSYGLFALLLGVAVSLPAFTPQTVFAEELTDRSVTMSSSIAGATPVTYEVAFTLASSSQSIRTIIVDFCSESPIEGTACSSPDGFSVGAGTVAVNSGITGTWTGSALNSDRTLRLQRSANETLSSGTDVSFDLTTVTNPSSANASFYARIFTYSTTQTGHDATDPGLYGAYTDNGSVALHTTQGVSVSARVAESLTFCVSKAAPGSNCTGLTAPTLTLGHGTPTALDSTAIDTDTAYTQVSTNASSGVSIRMKNANASGGLENGNGDIIPAVASGGAAGGTMTAGTAAFGVFVADGSGGTGTVAADANYNDGAANFYGMDTNGTNGAVSIFGDVIAGSTSPVNNVNNQLTFGATASNITPAGLYTANIVLIAAGTY